VTTVGRSGAVNLAPYSFFNAFCSDPPILGFASEGPKDSVTFAGETGEFVWNLPTYDLRVAMNATSASLPRGTSEFDHAGLATAASRLVKPPRVAASPCSMECKVLDIVELKNLAGTPLDTYLVLGQVIGVHLDDSIIADGRVDTAAIRPIARCGYADYAIGDHLFSMRRPG
jgi:flavin reductase (DIM6/NTAB) family NADH-FMN oxidoreductase RutF